MEHDSLTHPYAKSGFRHFKRCYYKLIEEDFSVDEIMVVCKYELEDCSVISNTDLEIEYEDWLKITGEFSTGVGVELDFHPE